MFIRRAQCRVSEERSTRFVCGLRQDRLSITEGPEDVNGLFAFKKNRGTSFFSQFSFLLCVLRKPRSQKKLLPNIFSVKEANLWPEP